jgi:hypothetical protein
LAKNNVDYQLKSAKTIDIELLIKEGRSVSAIARWAGVSRQRVQNIKCRMNRPQPTEAESASQPVEQPPSPPAPFIKTITLHITPSVLVALTEACALTNHENPDENVTVEDYAEECVINRLIELRLLRKNKLQK